MPVSIDVDDLDLLQEMLDSNGGGGTEGDRQPSQEGKEIDFDCLACGHEFTGAVPEDDFFIRYTGVTPVIVNATFCTVAKSFTLTDNHRLAIAKLASGATKTDTAQALNVSRVTINRWEKIPEFASELEQEIDRRARRASEGYQKALDKAQDEAIAQFENDLTRYKEQLLMAYRARIERGLKLLKKCGDRFDDLPDEAIGIKDMASLLAVGDRLIEKGFDQWGEALGLDEIVMKLNGKGGASSD